MVMRVAFFGTPDFAVPSLQALIASRHQVVGVITQPDRPRGRGHRVTPSPVKAVAQACSLPVLQPEGLRRDEFESVFAALHAEIGVVAAYGRILPEWLLAMPRHGMINVHASLLPKYRGAAPVQRAIVNGESQTGVTIMRVVKELDAGPMLAWQARPIGLEDAADEVERDLARIGAALLMQTLDDLDAGRAREIPQDESQASYAPRLRKEEGLLDFRLPALHVHNRIRGLRPWPTAWTFLHGRRLVVHRSRVASRDAPGTTPGTCIAAADAITIACGDGRAIDVLELQPEGRRVMTAREYVAGHGQLVGRIFG